MRKGFICFNSGSYKLLRYLNRKVLITNKTYHELEDIKNYGAVKVTLLRELDITTGTDVSEVWDYVRHNVWKWEERGNRSDSLVFNKLQSFFFDKLLKSGGVYYRDKLQKHYFTDQQIRDCINHLEDINLIIVLRTRRNHGNKIIYLLHPKVRREAKEK
jgi:hypothetical protein